MLDLYAFVLQNSLTMALLCRNVLDFNASHKLY